jgi:long-chain acyl-CoA synthetase
MSLLKLLVERVAQSSRMPAVRFLLDNTLESKSWREVASDIARAGFLLSEEGVAPGDRVWLVGRHSYELWCLDLALQSAGAVVVPIYSATSALDLDEIAKHTTPRFALLTDSGWGSEWRARGKSGICNFWDGNEVLRVARDKRPDWKRWSQVAKDTSEISAILHTSGTGGAPRAVALTSKGICFQLKALQKRLGLSGADYSYSCLPTAHVMGRLETYLPIQTGGSIAFSDKGLMALDDMPKIAPTFFVGVPRFYDVLKARIEAKKDPKEVLGANFRFGISGGAPLSLETGLFFARNDISVVEGYGLTEAGGAVAIGDPRRPVVGTVGECLRGMDARCDSHGEIWIRGKSVIARYWGERKIETGNSFSRGWFRTGDVGEWGGTHRKNLCVRDRLKDLIVTSNGKKIAPQKLESLLCSIPGVAQAMVFGEGEKYLTALVSVDKTLTQDALALQVGKINEKLAPHERIRDFRVLPGQFAISGNEITPTLKIRRHHCLQNYGELIREMYRDGSDRAHT